MSDFNELKVHISENAERKTDATKKQKNSQDSRIRKISLIVLPVVVVAVLVVSVIPSYLKHKSQYEQAQILLSMGQYNQAKEAFSNLGNYSDAKEQMEFNVDYVMAVDMLSGADPDNVEKLEGIKTVFESLDGYKDSNEKINKIDLLIDSHNEKVLKEAYDSAADLLAEKKYASASEAFKTLGNYRNSEEMVQECFYERAMILYDECISSDNLRQLYVRLNPDGEDYKVFTTVYPIEGDMLICDAAASEFSRLNDYKDCKEKAAECEDLGDFTKEFYELCACGKLVEAQNWLGKYGNEIENANEYFDKISRYLKYISTWEMKDGDPTLIPWSAGVNGKSFEIATTVIIAADGDYLVITGNDLEYEARLKLTDNGKGFSFSPDDITFYYVAINQVNNLAFMKYDSEGHLTGSSEYRCQ